METGFWGVPDVNGLIFVGLALTSLCAAFITGSAGAAGGLLVRGTLALVFPPAVLLPVHTFVMLGDNLGRVVILWRYLMWRVMLPVFIGAAIGAAAGGQIFVALPTATLQCILGIFIIIFTWMPKIANVW